MLGDLDTNIMKKVQAQIETKVKREFKLEMDKLNKLESDVKDIKDLLNKLITNSVQLQTENYISKTQDKSTPTNKRKTKEFIPNIDTDKMSFKNTGNKNTNIVEDSNLTNTLDALKNIKDE